MTQFESDKYTVRDMLFRRLANVFRGNQDITISFSGGKDSLVLLEAVRQMVVQGKVAADRITVMFVDEEAIYPCVERIVYAWRKIVLALGMKFIWFCLPVRHYNCVNMLTNDMSYICWDPAKKNYWVRKMPSFAIQDHPQFKLGMTYQEFLALIPGTVQLVGLRISESIQRAKALFANGGITKKKNGSYYVYPIYDWQDNDIWLFLKENKVDYPDAYLYMWKVGTQKRRLRISQFFSVDTMPSLVQVLEYYPNLYERIIAREPNAYIAFLYYDSEMFRRSTKKRNQISKEVGEHVDWKRRFFELMKDPRYTETRIREIKTLRIIVMNYGVEITDSVYKRACETIIAGDPKGRSTRAISTMIRGTKI